jgi:hypothetical protein
MKRGAPRQWCDGCKPYRGQIQWKTWARVKQTAALVRYAEPIQPAKVRIESGGTKRPWSQGQLFTVRVCIHCGVVDCFGTKGKRLCKGCMDIQHRRQHEARLKWPAILAEDGPLCAICLYPVLPDANYPDPCSPVADHIIPLSRGGSHTRSNIQLAHHGCNARKGTSTRGIFQRRPRTDDGELWERPGGATAIVPLSWVRWECETHGITSGARWYGSTA